MLRKEELEGLVPTLEFGLGYEDYAVPRMTLMIP
jgi:hypothetical protein